MEELETFINIFLKKAQAESEEKRQEAFAAIQEIRSSPNGFMHLIENFHAFKTDVPKNFTIFIIKSVMFQRWNDIAESFIEPIQNFLFINLIDTSVYQSLEEETANLLAETQAYFVAKTFPAIIPNFLAFFESCEMIVRLRFINSLCKNIAFPEPPIVFHQSLYMELIPAFTEIIFVGIQQTFPIAFSALSYFCRWCHNEWLKNEELIQCFEVGFTIPNLREMAANVVVALLMSSGDDQETVAQLIERFQVVEHISEVLEEDDAALLLAYARLVSACGNTTLNSNPEMCASFFQIAVDNFLSSPNDEIASSVISFIDTYTSLNPDIAPEILNAVIQRLAVYFENEPVKTLLFCVKLSHLASTALRINSDSQSVIDEMIDPSLQENPNLCAAVMHIVYFTINARTYTFSTFSDIFQFFAALIQTEPPLSRSIFPAILAFYRLALSNPVGSSDIDADVVSAIVETLLGFITSENETDEINKQLTLILGKFMGKFIDLFTLSDEIIQGILEIGTKESISALNNISNALVKQPEAQVTIISSIIEYLVGKCNESENGRDQILLLLTYISSLNAPYHEELLQHIHSLIETYFPVVSSDEELLCLLIESIKSISYYGFDLIYAIYGQVQENMKCVSAIARTCAVIRMKLNTYITKVIPVDQRASPETQQLVSLLKSEQAIQFTASIADKFIGFIDDTWAACPLENEETDLKAFIINTIIYFQGAIVMINEETRAEFYQMIADIFAHYFNSPDVIKYLVSFANSALMFDPVNVTNSFVVPSFSCLYSLEFDTNNPTWEEVAKLIIKFHQNAHNKNPDLFRAELVKAFEKHGGEETAFTQYCGALTVLFNGRDDQQLTQALDIISDLSNSYC